MLQLYQNNKNKLRLFVIIELLGSKPTKSIGLYPILFATQRTGHRNCPVFLFVHKLAGGFGL